MAGDSYLTIYDSAAFQQVVVPSLSTLREGGKLDVYDLLTKARQDVPIAVKSDALDAAGQISLLGESDAGMPEHSLDSLLYSVGHALFAGFCSLGPEPDIPLTGTGLSDVLCSNRDWAAALNRHWEDSDWLITACLGPGSSILPTPSLWIALSHLETGAFEDRLGCIDALEGLSRLRDWARRGLGASSIGLAHVTEW